MHAVQQKQSKVETGVPLKMGTMGTYIHPCRLRHESARLQLPNLGI
jgi:hypothetical protein